MTRSKGERSLNLFADEYALSPSTHRSFYELWGDGNVPLPRENAGCERRLRWSFEIAHLKETEEKLLREERVVGIVVERAPHDFPDLQTRCT